VATNIMKTARGDDPELLRRLVQWYEQNAASPERAGAHIIRAIEKGTPRLLITPEGRYGDLLKRLMPVTGNKLMGDAAIRTIGVEDMRAKRAKQWRETMVEGKPDVR